MTSDDIIRMAREAGMERIVGVYKDGTRMVEVPNPDLLERFAALVTAAKDAEHQQTLALQQRSYEREIQLEVEAEREECAQIAESTVCDTHLPTGVRIYGTQVAAAIRARTP